MLWELGQLYQHVKIPPPVGRGYILIATPGIQIRNLLDGPVKMSSLLEKDSVCFLQSNALFGRQMSFTFGDLTTSEKHIQMFHTAYIGEANVYLVG